MEPSCTPYQQSGWLAANQRKGKQSHKLDRGKGQAKEIIKDDCPGRHAAWH